jgi:hypothetical protein
MPIRFNLQKYLNPIFFETGTSRGGGVQSALLAGFQKIISIEINEELHRYCQDKFAKEIAEGRVELFLGDTQNLLPEILKSISQPITFWLDAHNDGDGLNGEKNCPLYEELDVIARHPIKNHTVTIDDIRLVRNNDAWRGHSVHVDGLIQKFLQINPRYQFCFEDGYVANDVLAAFCPQDWSKNIALGKPAKQSSTSKWSQPNDAQGAVSGIKTGDMGFHTEKEESPWWQVDLEDIYELDRITIYNREIHAERASNLSVLVSQDERDWHIIHKANQKFGGVIANTPLNISGDRHKARYVRVQLNNFDYLHLDEVEVYGLNLTSNAN